MAGVGNERVSMRWTTLEGQSKASRVLQCLRSGNPLDDLDFLEKFEGRWDLRGIPLGELHELEDVNLDAVDLSFSDLSHLILRRCRMTNVLLNSANCIHLLETGCIFENVSFEKANLELAGLESRYTNVSFVRANFSKAFFHNPWFVRCDFSDARLKKLNFLVSHFVGCKFKGRLESVWFRGYYPESVREGFERDFGKTEPNPMTNVDFSEAELWDVMFVDGCDLSTVKLPSDGNHFLFRNWARVLAEAANEIRASWNGEFRDRALMLIGVYQVHAKTQDMDIVNRAEVQRGASKDFQDFAKGQEFADKFVTALNTAEARCCA